MIPQERHPNPQIPYSVSTAPSREEYERLHGKPGLHDQTKETEDDAT